MTHYARSLPSKSAGVAKRGPVNGPRHTRKLTVQTIGPPGG